MNFIEKYQKIFTVLFFFPLTFVFGIAVAEIFVVIYLIYFLSNLNRSKFVLNKRLLYYQCFLYTYL